MPTPVPPKDTQEIDETQLRPFYAPEQTRQAIFDQTLDAFQNKFPLENDYIRIEAKNWRYDPDKLHYGISQTKDAILKGSRLSTPLYADVKLVNKQTGETLDERKGHLMANVPYLTDRGVFVMKGVQYVTVNQTRLRPGIYTRLRESGDVEAHINVKSGTGQGMRMFMEPETGIFRVKIGDSQVKLYPILQRLGVSDDEMISAWGQKVFEVNRDAADTKAFTRFYDNIVGTRGPRLLDQIRRKGMKKMADIPPYGEPGLSGPSDPGYSDHITPLPGARHGAHLIHWDKIASGHSEGLDDEKIAFYNALTDALAPGSDQDSPDFIKTMEKHGFKSIKNQDGWKYELIKQAMIENDQVMAKKKRTS